MKNSDQPLRLRIEPKRWADQLCLQLSSEMLEIQGQILPLPRVDLFHDYEHAEVSPHILFANCQDDDSLIDFVGRYGPVVTSEHSEKHPPQPRIAESWQRQWKAFVDFRDANPSKDLLQAAEFADRQVNRDAPPHTVKRATQRLDELRSERGIFNAAMDIVRIVSEKMQPGESEAAEQYVSKRRDDDRLRILIDSAQTIVSGTSFWTTQHSRDQRWLREQEFDSEPEWRWSDSDQRSINRYAATLRAECELLGEIDDPFLNPFQSAQFLVASLLNAFPSYFEWVGDNTFELQPSSALEFGIRPILYAMLRNDLKAKRRLRRCAWQDCGRLFNVNRPDRICCSDSCSKKRYSQQYYEGTLKPRREKAKLAKSKKRKS